MSRVNGRAIYLSGGAGTQELARVFFAQVAGNVLASAVGVLPSALLAAKYGILKGLLGGAAISGTLLTFAWWLSSRGITIPTSAPASPASLPAATRGVG